MDSTDTLIADLSYFRHALERSDIDLEAQLKALADTVRRTVDSYLGLRVTLIAEGHSFTVTAMQRLVHRGDIASSARLPLAALTGVEAGSMIVFFAGHAGAFRGLAADPRFALRMKPMPRGIYLDDQLQGPRVISGMSGLSDVSQVNQAIGILLARGHTIDGARAELRRLTGLTEITGGPAASRLIQASQQPPGTGKHAARNGLEPARRVRGETGTRRTPVDETFAELRAVLSGGAATEPDIAPPRTR
jgi:hypothetical protein